MGVVVVHGLSPCINLRLQALRFSCILFSFSSIDFLGLRTRLMRVFLDGF